jgi:hypothetical protein
MKKTRSKKSRDTVPLNVQYVCYSTGWKIKYFTVIVLFIVSAGAYSIATQFQLCPNLFLCMLS